MSSGEINVGITADSSEFETQIENAKTAIDSLNQAIGPTSTELDSLSQTFTTVGGSADTLNQSTETLSTTLGQVPTSLTDAASGADTLAQSTEAAATSSDTLTSSAESLGTGIGTLGTSLDTAATSTTTLATETDTLSQSTDTTASSVDTLNQSVSDVSSGMSDAGSATADFGSSSDDAAGSVDTLSQSTQDVSSSMTDAGTSITDTATSTEDLSTNTDDAATNLDEFNTTAEETESIQMTLSQKVGDLATAFSALGTALFNTYTSYESMGFAQTNLEYKQKRYEGQVKSLEIAEKKLEQQHDDNKITDEQYQDGLDKLRLKQEALELQSTRLDQAETRLGWTHTRFYMSLLPTAIGIVASAAQIWSVFGSKISAAIPFIGSASGGFTGLLGTLGPVAIAIAAVGAAFLALKTNFLGVTDGLVAFGKSLGDMLPSLKPILGMIAGFGAALGIEFKESDKWKKYFFDNLNSISEFLYNFVNHSLRMVVTDVGNWIGEMAAAFQRGDAGEAARLFVEGIGKGISGFTNFVNDYIAPFVGQIVAFFRDELGPQLPALGKLIVDGIGGAIKWTGAAVKGLWDGFVQMSKDFFNTGKLSEVEAAIINTIAAWTGFKVGDIIPLWDSFWTSTKEFMDKSAAEKGQIIMSTIGGALQFTADTLAPMVTTFWDTMTQLLPSPENAQAAGKAVAQAIVEGIKTAGEILATVAEFIWGAITGAEISADTQSKITTAVNAFLGFVKTALTDVGAFFVGIGEGLWAAIVAEVGPAVEGISETVTQWGTDFINYIWEGILGGVQYFQELGNSIVAWIQEGWDALISSLSQSGQDMVNAIWDGILAAIGFFTELGTSIYNWINEGWATLVSELTALGEDMIVKIWDGLVKASQSIKDLPNTIWSWITEGAETLWTNLQNFGNDIVKNIIDGIMNAPASIAKAIQDAITGGGGGGGENKGNAIRPLGFGELQQRQNERSWYYDVQGFRNRSLGGTQFQNLEFPEGDISGLFAPEEGAEAGGAGGMMDFSALMAQIDELIVKFQELGQALTDNSFIWQSWASGINTILVPLSELIVSFIQTSVMANFQTLTQALADNSFIWQSWGEAINTILVPLSELIVAFITESVIANMTLLTQAIADNSFIWQSWAEALNTILVPLSELIVAFITESVNANLALMSQAIADNGFIWQSWAEAINTWMVPLSELIVAFIKESVIANLTLLNEAIVANQEVWSTLSTSLATYCKSMTTNFQNFIDAVIEGYEEGTTSTEDFHEALSNLSTSLATYMKSMTTNFQNFIDAYVEGADELIQATDDMVSSLEDLVEGLDNVVDAAHDATAALEEMKEAAEEAAEAASEVGSFRYGGSFIGPKSGRRYGGSFVTGFQHGGSFVSTAAQKFKGSNISELDKWELVTVIPLSNPSSAGDKNSRLLNAPNRISLPQAIGAANSGALMGRAGGGSPVFTGTINNYLTLPDGRIIAQVANPFLLEGQDADL